MFQIRIQSILDRHLIHNYLKILTSNSAIYVIVDDILEIDERFEELGVELSKKPYDDGKMKGLVFIEEKQLSFYILSLLLSSLTPSIPS